MTRLRDYLTSREPEIAGKAFILEKPNRFIFIKGAHTNPSLDSSSVAEMFHRKHGTTGLTLAGSWYLAAFEVVSYGNWLVVWAVSSDDIFRKRTQ